jgi:hypothetical protein
MSTYRTSSPSFQEFVDRFRDAESSVILLEGSRQVDPKHAPLLTDLAARLAEALPSARFRSGNADGADTLFAAGVQSVDPTRMQVITPYAGHRKKNLHPAYDVCALSDVSAVHEGELAETSVQASPSYGNLMGKRKQHPRLAAKANYLLRDTLKVVGDPERGLAPADAAVLYPKADPMEGGTGHTLRVCQQLNVPFILFAQWRNWLGDGEEYLLKAASPPSVF